jgi:hypothetical protein
VDCGTLSASLKGAHHFTPTNTQMKTRDTSWALGMLSLIFYHCSRYSKTLSLGNRKQYNYRTVRYRTPRHLTLDFWLISDEPEDYDEIADEGITMDYANRVLNADDDMDTDPTTNMGKSKTKETDDMCKTGCSATPGGSRPRLSSTTSSAGSSASSFKPVSSTLTQLYSTTAKGREAAFPPRVLGGGVDPLPYWRFGALSDDARHHLASHRHIFEATQNISTSFDPKTMHCTCCTSMHPVLARAGGGGEGLEHKCFILSDQCFPPVLPSTDEGSLDCPAIILVENAHPYELAGVFLDLARGHDVPIGTVVVLSSLSHLGRVGTAAYAGDVVRAIGRIRGAYGVGVRVVHGFPLVVGGLEDKSTVRGLREVECWLAEVDKRRQYSLPLTSAYFTSTFLQTNSTHVQSTSGNTRYALRLPLSLHLSDSCAFISPGWEDLPRSLPTLGEEDEQSFMNIMLNELNDKFALQLDVNPNVDRSDQIATDHPGEENVSVLLAGASHSVRLIDHLESANLTVVDSTVLGFRISEKSVSEITTDISEKLSEMDPARSVVVLQLLDNVSYECKNEFGDRLLPRKSSDGRYHAPGEISVIGKDTLREYFMMLQPIFRACKDYKVICVSPLPRYVWARCCDDPQHITNSEKGSFAADMGRGLRDLTINLRNMLFMRKLKNVVIVNSTEAMGIIPGEQGTEEGLDRIIALWGSDPVHPTRGAYQRLATKIATRVSEVLAEPETPTHPVQKKRKPDHRDQWVAGSQAVAPRLNPIQGSQQRGSQLRGRTPRGSFSRGRSPWRGGAPSKGGWSKKNRGGWGKGFK